MKRVNALAVGILAVLTFAASLSAQIVKEIPADSLAVIKVSNIDATNKKLIDFFAKIGLAEKASAFKDPLQSLKDEFHMKDGVNGDGDFAIILLDWEAYHTTFDQAMLLLVPVSDFDKFTGNFPNATKDGDVTVVPPRNDLPIPMYVGHWGDFAAISPNESVVAKPPTNVIKVEGFTAQELDGKDIVILGNMKAIRDKVLPEIESGRAAIASGIDQAIQSGNLTMPGTNINLPKYAPVIKAVADQVMVGTERFVTDTKFVSIGFNLSPDGIATTFMADFEPDSYLGKLVAMLKNTDSPLLAGLPDHKYLFLGGGVIDPKASTLLINDMLGPIEKSVTDLGPDGASITDMIANVKAAIATQTGYSVGIFSPTGPLTKGPLLQTAVISTGDAKALQGISRKYFTSMSAALKSMYGDSGIAAKATCNQDSKTVGGVSFDELHITFDASGSGQSPMVAQQLAMMNNLYGPDGLHQFDGVVNDSTLLTVSGLDDTQIGSVIDTIKAQSSPTEDRDEIKSVASQLPTDRIAVLYFPVDQWFIVGLNYAKTQGFDTGVKFPEGLSPIGATVSVDTSAVRYDSYVPMQLIEDMVSTALQINMSMEQRHGVNPGL